MSPADTVVTEVWGMHPEKFEKSFPIIHQAHSGYKSEVYAADCKLVLSPGTAATYTLGQALWMKWAWRYLHLYYATKHR